jgi:acyl-CoA synthetase (AMP-forming)/AMP-acid ligase II
MGVCDFTFYDVISRNAACYQERNAWTELSDNRSLTFSQYKEDVDHLAAGLQNSGIEKGDRIGILGRNSVEYFLLYGAVAALGAIIVPINWRLSREEIAYNLIDSRPKIIFVDVEFEDVIQMLRGDFPWVEQYFNIGLKGGRFLDFESLMNERNYFSAEAVYSDDGLVIIYTAAVAGKPRGALLSHNNLLCGNLQLAYFLELKPQDVHLNVLPLYHVGGLFMTAANFHAGSSTLNMTRFDAAKALQVIERNRVTVMLEFPPILSSILDQQEKTGKNIKSLRAVGGLDSSETIERYQRVSGGYFYASYGQTETSCVAAFGRYDEAPGSSGRILPMVQMRLEDDSGEAVPLGARGEIAIRGPMVFKGYWNLPEDNSYTFRGGWHHTGDLGRLDEEGFLWFEGRKAEKDLIKPGGENVYPVEVEKVILQHPAIERCVVFGVPDPKWKEAIKAVCQVKKGESIEAQKLIDFVGERIGRYKKPSYVEFVTHLPLLENGSLDRAKIKSRYGGF